MGFFKSFLDDSNIDSNLRTTRLYIHPPKLHSLLVEFNHTPNLKLSHLNPSGKGQKSTKTEAIVEYKLWRGVLGEEERERREALTLTYTDHE